MTEQLPQRAQEVDESSGNGRVEPEKIQLATPEIVRIDKEDGGIKEMTDKDRARLVLAYTVLIISVVLMAGSGLELLWVDKERLDQAKTLWEFSKTFCPPLITLVIGFYFTKE